VGGFAFSEKHLFGFTARVADHLVRWDVEQGVRADDPGTRALERRNLGRIARFFLPRMARVLLPFYSPHGRPMREPIRRRLARYEV